MAIGLPAWQSREAFEYVESLTGPLLAWEYLRRNPRYRAAWALRDAAVYETAGHDWGLLLLIDPGLDARAVIPIWQPDPPTTIRVIRAVGSGDRFKLYDLGIDRRAPGAVHDGEGTYLTASLGGNAWRVHVAEGLEPQDEIAISIDADAHARRRVAAAARLIGELEGKSIGSRKRASAPSRTSRFHASVLQALDGAAGGASHRDIAVAMHGAKPVARRWTADGELRASIRYFLKRGAVLVGGGYRGLIYR